MAIIADSSPLICFAKIGRSGLLQGLFELVLIPGAVHLETVVEGTRLHKSGVEQIEYGMSAGWIKIVTLDKNQSAFAGKLRSDGQTGKGEAEALSLAKDRGLPIILDDKHARQLARVLGLEFIGSAAVLLLALRRRQIDRRTFFKGLEDLSNVMWLSPEVVARLVLLAEEGK